MRRNSTFVAVAVSETRVRKGQNVFLTNQSSLIDGVPQLRRHLISLKPQWLWCAVTGGHSKQNPRLTQTTSVLLYICSPNLVLINCQVCSPVNICFRKVNRHWELCIGLRLPWLVPIVIKIGRYRVGCWILLQV